MRFGAAFWMQRTDWPLLRDACLAVERAGWDSLWIDDHLLADEGDWRDAKLEGWTTLAAAGGADDRASGSGLLVAANDVPQPGADRQAGDDARPPVRRSGRPRASAAAGSSGSTTPSGIDFGTGFGERLDRLDEAVGLIRRLLDGERITHEGRFYRFDDALCEPRPIQARLPILIGGSGPTKTLRTTARYADLWNGYGAPDRIADDRGPAPSAVRRSAGRSRTSSARSRSTR